MNEELEEFIKNNFSHTGDALDLGCGDGKDLDGLRRMGWSCKGVDILTGTDLNNFHIFKKDHFDLIYSNYVIHKLDNCSNFIKTIIANLKPGGGVFLCRLSTKMTR